MNINFEQFQEFKQFQIEMFWLKFQTEMLLILGLLPLIGVIIGLYITIPKIHKWLENKKRESLMNKVKNDEKVREVTSMKKFTQKQLREVIKNQYPNYPEYLINEIVIDIYRGELSLN